MFNNNIVICTQLVNPTAAIKGVSTKHMTVTSNVFRNCESAVSGSPQTDTFWNISGNSSFDTQGATALVVSGTATGKKVIDDNAWDLPLQSTLGAGWGGSPAILCQKNWQGCTITVGTVPGAGPYPVNFPWKLSSRPVCVAQNATSGLALTVTTTVDTASIAGTVLAADVIDLLCQGI